MGKYQKKPVVVEAIQWKGDNLYEIQRFYKPSNILVGDTIKIKTTGGIMTVHKGDWIIKTGVDGEFYPCKSDIFEEIFEPLIDGEGV